MNLIERKQEVDKKYIELSKSKKIQVLVFIEKLHKEFKKQEAKNIVAEKYKNSMNSQKWRNFRAKIIKWKTCEICWTDKKLCLHHTNYDNIWNETKKDIKIVCENCHKNIHYEIIDYELVKIPLNKSRLQKSYLRVKKMKDIPALTDNKFLLELQHKYFWNCNSLNEDIRAEDIWLFNS